MSNNLVPNNKSHNPNLRGAIRKSNDPRYKRVLVGYRMVPMASSHVETPAGKTRCQLCWLLNATTPTPGQKAKDHFCRWNIAAEGPRDPNPPMRQVPVYRWVEK